MSVFDELRADIDRRAAAFRAQNGGVYPDPPEGFGNHAPACGVCQDRGYLIVAFGEPAEPCTTCDVVARMRRAKFNRLGPVPAPYDRYTFADFPGAWAFSRRAEQIAAAAPHHLFLWGTIGSGKTSLATCIYQAWVAGGVPGMWFTVPDTRDDRGQRGLLQHIRDSYNPETRKFTESAFLDAIGSAPLLLLDDIGAERVTEWVAERLYTVVSSRAGKPTIFTSNLDLDGLALRLGGLDGERIASRIQGMCEPHIYEISGPDLRQAKNRRAQ